MDNKLKTITNGLIPANVKVEDATMGSAFSEFCESTCSNLFAFSPYELHLGREEFLHFQFLADELKSVLAIEGCSVAELSSLCSRLMDIYVSLMESCWEAFLCDTDISGEPGKFVVLQMLTVEKYENAVRR